MSPRALENIAAPKPETFGIGLSATVSKGQASFRDALRRANQTAIRERTSDEASAAEVDVDARSDSPAGSRQAEATTYVDDGVTRSSATPDDDSPPAQETDGVVASTAESSPAESEGDGEELVESVDDESVDAAAALGATVLGATSAIVAPPPTAPLSDASAVAEAVVEPPTIEVIPAASSAPATGPASLPGNVALGNVALGEAAADDPTTPTQPVDTTGQAASSEIDAATKVESASSEQPSEPPTNSAAPVDAPTADVAAIAARAPATVAASGTSGVAPSQASAKSGTSDGETASGDEPRERDSDEPAISVVAAARPSAGSPATAPSVDAALAAAAKLVERADGERTPSEKRDSEQSPPTHETPKATASDAVAVEGVSPRGGQVLVATGVRGSETMEAGGSLTHAERGRLIARVARAMQTAHDRGGELKLRLSPPELGSLRLQVQVADGVLTARIEAETREAQQIITDNLLVLRDRLAQQDIRIERLSVDLFNSGTGGGAGTPQHGFDRQADGGGAARFGTSEIRKDGAEAGPAPAARSVASASSSGLNVVV